MTDAERHRDEALAMVEKLAETLGHERNHDFRSYPASAYVEVAQFLIRVRSEMLKEETE